MSLTFTPYSFLTTGEQDADLFRLSTELTVAQAARVLDIPEACILELFKLGALGYRQEGTQYWIDRDELFEYKRVRDGRRAWLEELARESQEMWPHDLKFDLEEYNATRDAIRNEDSCS